MTDSGYVRVCTEWHFLRLASQCFEYYRFIAHWLAFPIEDEYVYMCNFVRS